MKLSILILSLILTLSGFSQNDTTIYKPSGLNEFVNWCYVQRFRLCHNHIKPVKFKGEKVPVDLTKGNKLSNDYIVSYGDLSMVFKPECIEIKDSSVEILTIPYNDSINNGWQDAKFCQIKSGWYDYRGVYPVVYGTWEVKFSCSENSRPAIWMLKERHFEKETSYQVKVDSISGNRIYFKNENPISLNWFVYSDTVRLGSISALLSEGIEISTIIPPLPNDSILTIAKDNITPEIDLFENVGGELAQSVHWHPSLKVYKQEYQTAYVCKFEPNTIYTVAVMIKPNKVIFYVNGIKTGVVWVDTPENAPSYLIFSNGTNWEGIDKINKLSIFEANIYK